MDGVREWLVDGGIEDLLVLSLCVTFFALGRFWGRMSLARQVMREAEADPKSIYDWAEALRAEELRVADEGRG